MEEVQPTTSIWISAWLLTGTAPLSLNCKYTDLEGWTFLGIKLISTFRHNLAKFV